MICISAAFVEVSLTLDEVGQCAADWLGIEVDAWIEPPAPAPLARYMEVCNARS